MLNLNQFNLIVGMGFDEWDKPIDFLFHEQEGGVTDKITVRCGPFSTSFNVDTFMTAHLPQVMSFRRTELCTLYRKLREGYKDYHMKIPFQFDRDGLTILSGPGRNSRVPLYR